MISKELFTKIINELLEDYNRGFEKDRLLTKAFGGDSSVFQENILLDRMLKILKDLKANIDKPISSILTLNTFAHTMGAAGVGAQAAIVFGEQWQSLVAFILTLLVLYITEIYPKTYAALYWKRFLVPTAYLISFLIKVTYPFIWVGTKITNYIQKNKSPSCFRHSMPARAIV